MLTRPPATRQTVSAIPAVPSNPDAHRTSTHQRKPADDSDTGTTAGPLKAGQAGEQDRGHQWTVKRATRARTGAARSGGTGGRRPQVRRPRSGTCVARRGTAASGSPQQRALLAALLLREGRTATAAELIDAVWGEDPPSQALAALRTYASRLRKILDAGRLVTEAGGYALRIGPERSTSRGLRSGRRGGEGARRRGPRPAREPARQGAGPVGRRAAGRGAGPVRREPAHPAGGVAAPAHSRPGSTWTWSSAATRRRSPN